MVGLLLCMKTGKRKDGKTDVFSRAERRGETRDNVKDVGKRCVISQSMKTKMRRLTFLILLADYKYCVKGEGFFHSLIATGNLGPAL